MRQSKPKIKIYAGLSLSESELHAVLPDAEFHGPIERFDLLKDIDLGYNVVGIIDGKFQNRFTVNSGEILDAIRCGLKIYGGSSMGALRAAETEALGMVGCGKIFEMIRQTPLFRDDFLGQSIGYEDLKTSSIPYVDLHFEVERKLSQGSIQYEHAEKIRKIFSEIFYLERYRESLIWEIKKQFPEDKALENAALVVFQNFQSQKNIDAKLMLERIKQDLILVEQQNHRLWEIQKKSRDERNFFK